MGLKEKRLFEKYSLKKFESREIADIPLNPCTVSFSMELEKKFWKDLSKGLKENKFNEARFLILVVVFIVIWMIGSHEEELFIVQTSIGGILIIILGILIFYLKSLKRQRKLLYFGLYVSLVLSLVVFYFSLTDPRVLQYILSNEKPEELMSSLIPLVLILRYSRLVLLDKFVYILPVGLISILSFSIGIFLHRELTGILELVFLILFTVFELIDIYGSDWRAHQLFFRLHEEKQIEKSFQDTEQANPEHLVALESEELVNICEQVNQTLRQTINVLIFVDIKKQLKKAMVLVSRIKNSIKEGALFSNIKETTIIPEDVHEFLEFQGFLTTIRPSMTSGHTTHMTLANLMEDTSIFPELESNHLHKSMENIGELWDFDIWFIEESLNRSVSAIGCYFAVKWKLDELFQIPREIINNYFSNLENAYKTENPYHNACHAADVFHSFLYLIQKGSRVLERSSLDCLALLLAALGHDVCHPGLNNNFLVNSRDKLAFKYNDISVLENMHSSEVFKLMNSPSSNILGSLENEDWVYARKLVVEVILNTDPSKHFEQLGAFRLKCDSLESSLEDKIEVYSIAMKAADIGHTAKCRQLHTEWTARIIDEFTHEGIMEKQKGQELSMNYDRNPVAVAKSQLGFINMVAIPLYRAWYEYGNCEEINEVCLQELKSNYNYWQEEAAETREENNFIPNTSFRYLNNL